MPLTLCISLWILPIIVLWIGLTIVAVQDLGDISLLFTLAVIGVVITAGALLVRYLP